MQRLGRHIGLERLIFIRERREFEGHGNPPVVAMPTKAWRKLKVPCERGKPSR
jgi:hypothetical protein